MPGARSRKTMGVLVGASMAVCACRPDARYEDRPLVVYSPAACAVTQTDAYSIIYGNGDFDDSETAVASIYLPKVGTSLPELPPETRSVIVYVSQPAQRVDWRGTAEIPASGPINVLVWPGGETCHLTRNVAPRDEPTLAVFGRHFMVTGGRAPGSLPRTFVGDLSTGIVEGVATELATGRTRATITAFRASRGEDPAPALVAGGEDPGSGEPLASAEIYAPKPGARGDIGGFERATIDLASPRTKHGAVVLGSGETLLVGGAGASGAPLGTMEIVDPTTRASRASGLATLRVPRSSPTVLRLASGEVLVAGGFDASGAPVRTLEWFSPDGAAPTKTPIDLVAGEEQAVVPLEAGGALAVIRPAATASTFSTVWVISAGGALEAAQPIDPTALERVRLFPGTDGAPALWTGARWLRWQAWQGAFEPISDAPTRGPREAILASGDPGLALWLDDRADVDERAILDGQLFIRGFRFATRSRFAAVRNALLVAGPAGLTPDRLVGTPTSALRFVPGRGLELEPGASAFVTDVTFSTVTVEIDGGRTPYVVLRQEDGRELEVGGPACPLSRNAATSLRVERHGAEAVVYVDDDDGHACPAALDADARVTVGVRGAPGAGVSLARNLRITRH